MRTWKKVLAGLVALGLLLAPNPLLAQYGGNYFWWQVIDEVGKPYGGQSAVECSVYEIASHGAALMHFDATLSPPGSTQPLLSDTTGKFHFYSSNTDDKRVICFSKRGGIANDVRLDRFTHRIMIDRQGRKVVRFPFVTNTATTNTGIWLPQGSLIRDVLVQSMVSARQGDNHLNVGFRGAHAEAVNHAFVRQMHLASTGSCSSAGSTVEGPCPEFKRPGVIYGAARIGGDLFNQNNPAGVRLHVAGSHRGVTLAQWQVGAFGNAVCSAGGIIDAGFCHYGLYIETPYVVHVAGGIELIYSTSAGSGLNGHVWILYDSFHTGLDQSITK